MEWHQIFAACASTEVVVAEWLRRWTRNPLGSPRAGSNPADYGFFNRQRKRVKVQFNIFKAFSPKRFFKDNLRYTVAE